jgi:hypothetical protein
MTYLVGWNWPGDEVLSDGMMRGNFPNTHPEYEFT